MRCVGEKFQSENYLVNLECQAFYPRFSSRGFPFSCFLSPSPYHYRHTFSPFVMRPTLRLWAQASRITFFTSPNCSLCDKAKAVVKKVQARRQFEYVEINIREEGQQRWMDKYAFDTPVVSDMVLSSGVLCSWVFRYMLKLLHSQNSQTRHLLRKS